MKPQSANFKKLMAVLVVIGLAVVGTYAMRSALHRHSSAIVALAAGPPQEAPKQAITATPPPVVGGGQYSPNVGQTVPDRVYWGAAHNHTSYSFDAGMFGVTLTPDDLFKFATGGEVTVDNGMKVKIDGPLDWLAITDHAEYMGISDQIREGNPDLLANPRGWAGARHPA